MAVTTFIPEVWVQDILATLRATLVVNQPGVVNTDYQGDISQRGDVVHIPSLVDPTIGTYVRNVTVLDPEQLATTAQDLLIDQAKFFAFEVDDVDAAQVAGNLIPAGTNAAAVRLAEVADAYTAGLMIAGAGTTDTTAITSDNVVDELIDGATALTTAKVPLAGRFALVNPATFGLLLKSDEFQRIGQDNGGNVVENATLGTVAGMRVWVSQALGTAEAVVGHPIATTFAQQISKVEGYRPDNAFSDAVKGLHLYGAKVVRPAALYVLNSA